MAIIASNPLSHCTAHSTNAQQPSAQTQNQNTSDCSVQNVESRASHSHCSSDSRLLSERPVSLTEGEPLYQLEIMSNPTVFDSIACHLTVGGFFNLRATHPNFKALLSGVSFCRNLAAHYYGSGENDYRTRISEHINIPPVPDTCIEDKLLRLAYHRWDSNIYLESQQANTEQLCMTTLKGHTMAVTSITPFPDVQLASGSLDESVIMWDLNRPEGQQRVATLHHSECIDSITTLTNGLLALSDWDNNVEIWDMSCTQCIATIGRSDRREKVPSLTALPNDLLAIGSYDYTVKVWDSEGIQCQANLKGHKGAIYSVSPLDRQRLASSSADKTIKIWNLDKPERSRCVRTLQGHKSGVTSLTPLAGNHLASGSYDKTVKIWDLCKPEGRECVATLTHREGVTSVTVLLDGRVVSGCEDNTIYIWDLSRPEGRQCVVILTGHTSTITSLAILTNGQLVSASRDSTMKVWNLNRPMSYHEKNLKESQQVS